jgi:hypothetical protein
MIALSRNRSVPFDARPETFANRIEIAPSGARRYRLSGGGHREIDVQDGILSTGTLGARGPALGRRPEVTAVPGDVARSRWPLG